MVPFGSVENVSEIVSFGLSGSLNLMTYLIMLLLPLKGSIQDRLTVLPVTFEISNPIGFSGLSVLVDTSFRRREIERRTLGVRERKKMGMREQKLE